MKERISDKPIIKKGVKVSAKYKGKCVKEVKDNTEHFTPGQKKINLNYNELRNYSVHINSNSEMKIKQ
mgnify:FL=1